MEGLRRLGPGRPESGAVFGRCGPSVAVEPLASDGTIPVDLGQGALAVQLAFVGVGTFYARPYCRWFCPYGALVSLASRFSWKYVRVTPDRELDCGLCPDHMQHSCLSIVEINEHCNAFVYYYPRVDTDIPCF